jgi:hypothetical protein|nr:hypothetical protein [Candidatus Krumholzibacteria bacterium]
MSEKDFDWNDDLDFESLADEKEMAADYGEPGDNFSDFEDLADYAEPAEDQTLGEMDPAEVAPTLEQGENADPKDQEPAAPPAMALGARTQKVVSAGGLNLLLVACTLVGALGMAGALLLAGGLQPAALLDFSGFTAVDRIFDFQTYPVNLVYMVTAGLLLLVLGGASVISRHAREANQRHGELNNLLGRVTALRLDDEEAWNSNSFKQDADTATFVSEILGAWRLQQSRHVRAVGLEGELRRLEKALREDSRTDLADRYDHPMVGSLADAMLSYYDDRDAARKETATILEKDEFESGEVLSLIEDARSWNQAGQQKVEVQETTLQRWATRFEELVQKFAEETGHKEAIAGLQGLQGELARAVDKAEAQGTTSLDDLVDRGSKLAFQIAMEVARLGPRGERLLPMSQSLEELTTQFRQTVSKSRSEDGGGATSPQSILTRLEQITVQLVKEGPGGAGNLLRTLQDLAPASRKLADNLGDISGSFGHQTNRLDNLGTRFASMTGLEFDPEEVSLGVPDNPAEGGLNIQQNDPFGREQNVAAVPTLEVDPFGANSDDRPSRELPLAETGISTDVTPGHEDTFAEIELERSNDFSPGLTEDPVAEAAAIEAESVTAPDPFAEPELSSEEDRVYDLAEFGAVRIDQQQTAPEPMDDQDRIYDLVEFGAVALT